MKLIRVLFVEDNEDDMVIAIERLRSDGYEVTSQRVETARDLTAALKKQWDCVISDYKMPELTGEEALEITKASGNIVPFVLLSGTIGEEIAVEIMKKGAADYLLKDKLGRLGAAIARAMDEKRLQTERKLIEEALIESEERYRTLFVNMLEGYSYCRMFYDRGKPQDFVYIEVNDAFEKLTGLKDVGGKKVSEVIPGIKESNPEVFEVYGRVALTGKPEKLETYVEPLGIWFSIAVYSPAKEFFVAVFDNITERKRAEESLTYERNLLKAVMDNMPDHIYFKDKESRFLKISRSQAEYFGLKNPDEAVGKSDFDFFGRSHAQAAFQDEQKIIKSGIIIDGLEENELRRDGLETWVSTTKLPLRDTRGEIIGTFGISRDITKQKQADLALKQSEEKYRRLFEESKDAIYISSADSKILDINTAGLELLGYGSKEELEEMHVGENIFINPERNSEFKRQMNVKGFVKDFETELRRNNGHIIHVIETATPVRDNSGTIIGSRSIIRDVTNQRQLEQELIQAQKMESVGTLASGIAHDFNNILGIILGYASIIERSSDKSDSLSQSLDAIKNAVDRGAGLVKQILTFARKTEVTFGPLDPHIMIKEMVKLLHETFPKSIIFSTKLSAKNALIYADATQVHQVVLNLCVNARDAMADHGTLTLSTVIVDGSTLRAIFPNVVNKNYLCLQVTDTGSGMDEATKAKIFDPFFTTKEKGKGTGLGLSVVYGVMKNHNGFVNVQSELGKGSTFNLYFPLTEQLTPAVPKSKAQWENVEGGTETILFVEDEVSIVDIVKTMLEMKGYHLIVARDGKQGIDLFLKHKEQIALVLTDIGLPKLNGIEMFRELKTIDPHVRAILASGYIDPEMKSEALKSGVREFIQKPYDLVDVLQKLRSALDDYRGS
ncbi:MAG TPA: PAS domain S-box protein [Bacteroidota bacterium]|nr:PAS domain S-box protein [Bacteroidota bacterium]